MEELLNVWCRSSISNPNDYLSTEFIQSQQIKSTMIYESNSCNQCSIQYDRCIIPSHYEIDYYDVERYCRDNCGVNEVAAVNDITNIQKTHQITLNDYIVLSNL